MPRKSIKETDASNVTTKESVMDIVPLDEKNSISASKDDTAHLTVDSLTVAFTTMLDNPSVISKLAEALSVSIQLILDEKLKPINNKLDKIVTDNKVLNVRIAETVKKYDELKEENVNLTKDLKSMMIKLNAVEQYSRRNNIVINGIPESFAEKASPVEETAASAEPTIETSRTDTVNMVCTVINEACGQKVSASDIYAAFRIKTKKEGPRPIVVSFHSFATRQLIVKSRRPKQKLLFRGNQIYINDHLTEFNSKVFHSARDLVNKKEAHATWTTDGQIFIKWDQTSRALRVQSPNDLL